MEELRPLVVRAREGDLNAYGEIVRRFQDMAFGYAYALLGDFHLAEDAVQEAFIQAYHDLGKLDDPAAFPGWFRRIVFKHCDRLTRRTRVPTVSLASAGGLASAGRGPTEEAEKREMADKVLEAIRSLPESQRTVTTLFYINGYSQKDIAEFLEVPVTTVNNRLHASRRRLKERMTAMVEDELKGSRPGREFLEGIMREISQVEIRPEKSPADAGRVLLVDDQGRGLMVIIGKAEEAAVGRGLIKEAPPRPLTHELFLSALRAFGISVKETRITDLRDGTFIGELVLARGQEERVLDSRPSDAVALALMAGARITVAENVLQEGGARPVSSESDRERMWETVPIGFPEGFNRDLAELCEALHQLTDEALATIVNEVGIGTVSMALAAATVEADESRPGCRLVGVRPTRGAKARERLPLCLPELLSSLCDRIKGIEEAVPRWRGIEEAIKARKAIREAIGRLPGPQ